MKRDLFGVLSVLVASIVAAGVFVLAGPSQAGGSISFGKSVLQGETSERPTSLQFGPDGRLYVAQQNGLIKVYTVARNGANDYSVTATETINLVRNIPNHDDNGTLNTTLSNRQILGILVKGTASNPVLYVSSSDPRIGGGADGGVGDLNLDTNSGIISRLTWNGSSWNKVDLVRGLPRSERSHALNGMQLDEATNTLYLAIGGNTNAGAPSANFAFLPEYALSAAVLSIDLDAIGNTTYDLPTLNDESRSGSPDANDPFGGNDGKNQARLVPGGPVQVHASGFRNPYDVVIAENGKMYATDNGSNEGWGDIPVNEGPTGVCTNAVSEPGITTRETLHLVSPGYYGGHPNPTRGNTDNKFNPTNPQSPVQAETPVECDYRQAGVDKGELTIFQDSTNGLVEYTASNFDGEMQGDLLAAAYGFNLIYRVKLNAAGTAVVSNDVLFSTVGTLPLDITAQGDAGPFPGSIWVADIGSSDIVAFEPSAIGGTCYGADDPAVDDDLDGFDNADEIDNGTDPCNPADQPPDADGDKDSDLNDPNDDNDSMPDTTDPFAVDEVNGKSTNLPVSYTWDSEEEGTPSPGGLLNLGFTGLMTDGATDYRLLYDRANMTAGAAAGVATVDRVPAGTANKNDQKYGFQFGVNATPATGEFTAHTSIAAPFAGISPQDNQSMGLFIGDGDQDDYVKLVVHANGGQGGLQMAKEVSGSFSTRPKATEPMPGPEAVDLYLKVDPAANTVQPSYQVKSGSGVVGPRKDLGGPVTVPAGWFNNASRGLAVGIISTSAGPGPEFPATWEFIEVAREGGPGTPPVVNKPPENTLLAGTTISTSSEVPVRVGWSATDDSGTVSGYELQRSTNGGVWTDVSLSSATATTATPKLGAGGTYQFRVRARDEADNWSAWEEGAPFAVGLLQETNGAIVYSGTWATEALSNASGGAVKHASTSSNSATLTLSGVQNFAWVSTRSANRGQAEFRIDGNVEEVSDLYSSTTQWRRVAAAENRLNPSIAHTVEVKVLGTKNAASGGTRADIDAFVVLTSP